MDDATGELLFLDWLVHLGRGEVSFGLTEHDGSVSIELAGKTIGIGDTAAEAIADAGDKWDYS